MKLLEYIIEKYGYNGYSNIFTCLDRNCDWKKYSKFIYKNMHHFDNDIIKKYLSTPLPYSDIILSGNIEKLKCFTELRNNSVYKSNIEVFTKENYVELFEYFYNSTYKSKNIEIHNIINIFINGIEVLEQHGVFMSKELFINNITKICIDYNDCYEYKSIRYDSFDYKNEYEYNNIPIKGIKDAKVSVFLYLINKYNDFFHQKFETLFHMFVNKNYFFNIKILIDNGFSLNIDKYKYILENLHKICDEEIEHLMFDTCIIKDKLFVCKYFAFMCNDFSLYKVIKIGFPYDDELILTIIKNKLKITFLYMYQKGLITMKDEYINLDIEFYKMISVNKKIF